MVLELDRRVILALCGAFLLFGLLTFAAGLITGVAMTADAVLVQAREGSAEGAAPPAATNGRETGAPGAEGGAGVPLRGNGTPPPAAGNWTAGVPLNGAGVSLVLPGGGAGAPASDAPSADPLPTDAPPADPPSADSLPTDAPPADPPSADSPSTDSPGDGSPEADASEAEGAPATAPPPVAAAAPVPDPAPDPTAAADEEPELVAPMLMQDRPALVASRMPPRPRFSVQVGAFLSAENATRLSETLEARGYDVAIRESSDRRGRTWFYVQTGAYDNYSAAVDAKDRLRLRERIDAIVVQVQQRSPGAA